MNDSYWSITVVILVAYAVGLYAFGPAAAIESVAAGAATLIKDDSWVVVLSNLLSAIPPTIAALAALWVSISSQRKVQDIKESAITSTEAVEEVKHSAIVNTKIVEEIKEQNNQIHMLVNSRLSDALKTIEDLKSMLVDMSSGKAGVPPSSESRRRAKAAVKKAS